MAYKCSRILLLLMIELLIFIFLKVQTNDFAHISFYSSSPLTLLPHVSKLNKVQTNDIAPTTFGLSPTPILHPHSSKHDEVQGKMYTCIADAIKDCKKMWPLFSLSPHHWDKVTTCIIYGHGDCWRHHSGGRKISIQYIDQCMRICLEHLIDVDTCFDKCYKKHF